MIWTFTMLPHSNPTYANRTTVMQERATYPAAQNWYDRHKTKLAMFRERLSTSSRNCEVRDKTLSVRNRHTDMPTQPTNHC